MQGTVVSPLPLPSFFFLFFSFTARPRCVTLLPSFRISNPFKLKHFHSPFLWLSLFFKKRTLFAGRSLTLSLLLPQPRKRYHTRKETRRRARSRFNRSRTEFKRSKQRSINSTFSLSLHLYKLLKGIHDIDQG